MLTQEALRGPDDPQLLPAAVFKEAQDELANLMTIVYVLMQATLSNHLDLAASYVKLGRWPSGFGFLSFFLFLYFLLSFFSSFLPSFYPHESNSNQVSLEPPIPDFMMTVASRLRWDDNTVIPQCQVFLLLWKSLLLVFGGSRELQETKKATAESTADADKENNLIMASPLDYHAFRQEITSKYPAYIPPQPLIPLEDESTTLLPPLQHHSSSRNNAANGVLPGPPSAHGGASILNQPVHIATPAPSPPPSPAAGGKGGKKQNYQTNQNFPFMYPPLDATSNGVGGKGAAALQDALVGRKWEGSDVPSSILEAGELFSNRVRMTRATRQLWEERERFLKFERGWDSADDDLIEELDLSSLTLAEKEELGLVKPSEVPASKKDESNVDLGPRPEGLNERARQRLESLEDFYVSCVGLVCVLYPCLVSVSASTPLTVCSERRCHTCNPWSSSCSRRS